MFTLEAIRDPFLDDLLDEFEAELSTLQISNFHEQFSTIHVLDDLSMDICLKFYGDLPPKQQRDRALALFERVEQEIVLPTLMYDQDGKPDAFTPAVPANIADRCRRMRDNMRKKGYIC